MRAIKYSVFDYVIKSIKRFIENLFEIMNIEKKYGEYFANY